MLSTSSSESVAAMRRWRGIKDFAATYLVSIGGLAVIGAVLLIMVYLVAVVAPLFGSAKLQHVHDLALPSSPSPAVYIATEEQNEIAARFFADGSMQFISLADASVMFEQDPLSEVASFALVNEVTGTVAYGHQDGTATIIKQEYGVTYDQSGKRVITPSLSYPLGEEPLELVDSGQAIDAFSLSLDEGILASAALTGTTVTASIYSLEESWLGDGLEVELDERFDIAVTRDEVPAFIKVDPLAERLFVAYSDGYMDVFSLFDGGQMLQQVQLIRPGEQLVDLRFLRGGISLMAASNQGEVNQWFEVRDEQGIGQMTLIRSLDVGAGNDFLMLVEQRRKGFVTISDTGNLGVYYSTSERELLNQVVTDQAAVVANISPRANAVVIETADGMLKVYELHNEHPDISFSSLWGKVWYESYPEPDYIWQSSAATDDFEAKFSLTPLAFGTLKAAFYAMLIALPLAISGAIYTAYFMSPSLRTIVKPMIEIMEALPTVILGFLAGLWLAPLLETKLVGGFLVVLLVPIIIVLFGYGWDHAPRKIRLAIPDGWQPILLVIPILAAITLSFGLSGPIEDAFFAGNLPQWLTNEMGIDYDQRNSLVVGFAMGFAVIPTIFSITEDAVFGVPRHLSNGSLALGATPWQTLMRVVLPTASPGMFSAVMIGFGRAVGETMIVLMATGNTPIMDFNIFEGMRTLSANIAVEMPESEVGSSHYRILFLAGLVLLMFTFIFNTGAEIIRQRLRDKYKTV